MKNKIPMNNARKQKALLILPLLIIPFLTLGFWALGGGRNSVSKAKTISGLNLELPNALLKRDSSETKLGLYEQAEQDSARRNTQLKSDPLYRMTFTEDTKNNFPNGATPLYDPTPQPLDGSGDPNEVKVYRKLAELNEQLQESTSSGFKHAATERSVNTIQDRKIDTNRLQHLGTGLTQKEETNEADPELGQLNGMMDKIIAIQHPEQATNKRIEQVSSTKAAVYPVIRGSAQQNISLLDTTLNKDNPRIGFYGLEDRTEVQEQNAIEAVVDETQTLVDGGIVKLRLLDDISVNGVHIPKETFVFGKATLSGERLQIKIGSVRYQNSLYPVNLDVYDLDGQVGLYIPNLPTKDITNGATDNNLQMLNLATLDPSLKAQAATAGINTLKSLLSRKTKLVRVTVKAGYKVLLK